jgi:hypothetical protein
MSEMFPKLTIADNCHSGVSSQNFSKRGASNSLWTSFLNVKSTLKGKIKSAKRAAIV